MKQLFNKLTLAAATCLLSSTALAHDAHVNVAGNDTFSLSYDYMYMNMHGNLEGTDHLTPQDVLNRGFMSAPTEMETQTHTVTGSYQINDKNAVSVSLPYIVKDMDMLTQGMDDMMAMTTSTESMHSQGFGDTVVKGTYNVPTGNANGTLKLQYGLSLPTGSVTKSDNGMRLGYMMQTGSGTYDPILGAVYSTHYGDWNYGAGANTVLRFGHNDEGYRFGNEYNASVFVGRQLNSYVNTTLRMDGKTWGNIKGQDDMLDPMMDPTQVATAKGGQQVDAVVAFGLNDPTPGSVLKGTKLSAEFGVPLYQHLDGPQLAENYSVMVNLQKGF